MSADTDEKVQSKFPRASLRARNKTMMMQPADVADFQVGGKDDGFSALDMDDIFGDAPDSGHGAEVQTVAALGDESELGADAFGAVSELADDLGDELSSAHDETSHHDSGLIDSLDGAIPALTDKPEIIEATKREDIFTAPVPQKEEYRAPVSRALDLAASQPISRTVGSEVRIEWKKPSKLVGFLVSFASDELGTYVELREGRLLISSEGSSSDNVLVLRHESVSPMHAIMRISGAGEVLILDQLSEHGTKIRRAENNKEECLMGDKSALKHGDIVIFGECEYHVVLLGVAALKR